MEASLSAVDHPPPEQPVSTSSSSSRIQHVVLIKILAAVLTLLLAPELHLCYANIRIGFSGGTRAPAGLQEHHPTPTSGTSSTLEKKLNAPAGLSLLKMTQQSHVSRVLL